MCYGSETWFLDQESDTQSETSYILTPHIIQLSLKTHCFVTTTTTTTNSYYLLSIGKLCLNLVD